MRKLSFCGILLLFLLALTCTAAAKETVIYENDFSDADLSDFYVYGGMKVRNGELVADRGSGPSAFLSYTFPAEYVGKAYRVEVDFLGHSDMGGILIGADGEDLAEKPSYFHGYTCTTAGENGSRAYIAYFGKSGGWGGNFPSSTRVITEADIHLSVTVKDGAMTFRVTTLDGETQFYGVRYEIGDHEDDIYNRFTSTVGLRDYYADNGRFDNFKVTILEDDELPAMPKSLVSGGVTINASTGISLQNGVLCGNGAFLSDAAQTGNYRLSASVAASGTTRLYFGMRDAKNGYAFELDEKESRVLLYRIQDGVYVWLGEKKTPIRSGACTVTLTVTDGVAALYYDNLFQGDAAFPKFEFTLEETDGKFGFWLEGGSVQGLSVGESAVRLPEETYLNPVSWGADPDVLYYEGTYYLYNSVNDGNKVFRVYTSPDLAHWTPRNVVFWWDDSYGLDGKSCWSPNVFYHDGIFYLFYAALPLDGSDDRHLYYATSDSPYGPFVHENGPVALHPDIREIDGHPFRDDDGRIYISYSRYDLGGTIWIEEATFQDGVVTPVAGTASRVAVSDEEYDVDGAIRLCEGGFFFKHNGLYYMIYATGSYARHYGEAYAVAENVLGPYTKYAFNPVLTYNYALDGPGDALIVPSPDGSELYFVYHRHYEVGKVHPRHTCVDKIAFVKDPDGGPDILTVNGPTSTPQSLPSNQYRYDVNRDGKVNLADVEEVRNHIQTSPKYIGTYDIDANGSMGVNDVQALLREIERLANAS